MPHKGLQVPAQTPLHCCRFLNSRAAKAMFRADQMDLAERTAALFTKEGDQANNLHEMQCMWYEIEGGEAHLRQQQYGKVSQRLPSWLLGYQHLQTPPASQPACCQVH